MARRNCFLIGLIGGRSDSPIFLHLWLAFIPSGLHPLHFEFSCDTTAEAGRNRESTWVSIQNMWFTSQGLLPTESQFWLFVPPACNVTLGFPEYKLLLSSKIRHTFLGNLRTTTYPANLIFLICKEQPVLTQTSISTFSSQLHFGQNFDQLWLLPANHSCHSFYLLNKPVKSVMSLRIV